MSDYGKAVFLSYASQDAEAAKRLCEALRAAGVEVWFDQNELVGGDAWDQKIRRQIKECALLIPIISANTQSRTEGYFRLEWRLADQRTHLMAKGRPFLLPVVVDDTRDGEAHVPDSFTEVQWTKAPGGEAPGDFVARVAKLLGKEGGPVSDRPSGGSAPSEAGQRPALPGKSRNWLIPVIAGVVTVAVVAAWFARRPSSPPASRLPSPASPAAPAAGSEARQLVAKAWEQMIKPEMARVELDAADNLCKRAAELDPNDAEVWAAWSQVDSWYVYHRLESTPARREGARKKAALALSLSAQSYEARLAQACYLMREGGGQSATQYTADAEAGLRALLQERPDEPRALLSLGILQRNLGQVAAFRDSFGRMARSPAFAVQAYNELGWAEYFLGNFREAEAAIDASIKLHPYWANLNLKTYLLLCWWGDLDRAKLTADQIPVSGSQENYGLSVHLQVNQWRRDPPAMLRVINSVSRDWLQSNAADGPKAWWTGLAQQMAGQAEVAQLQWGIALKVVEQRLGDQPDSGHLLDWKGRLLLALGRRAEGESSLRLAHALGFKGYFDDDALSLILMGKEDAAIALLESRVEEKEIFLTAATLRLNPYFDPLRALPRYQALQAKLDADPRFSPVPKATSQKTAGVADDKSVAVLAFANLSDDKANEYFSDGISEELLNVLSKVPGLKVSARTSAFYFKGKEVPIPEIAKQLGVAYVVEGSVRKQGDKVRITAQLIKAADGFPVWSETFTRDIKDVFAVQDEIAGLIAQQLSLKLGTRSAAATGAVNPEAFELYVQARRAWNLRSAAGFAQAEELLTRALTLEPKFARAHVALADVWMLRAIANGVIDTFGQREAPIFAQITGGIQKALALDPDSSEARASWGLIVRLQQWDLTRAEREFRRSIALNPNYATAHHWLGNCLSESGRIDEGLAELRRAAELDPFSLRILQSYAEGLVHAGQPGEALAVLDRAEALQARSPLTLILRSEALLKLGRRAEMIATARELDGTVRAELLARAGEKAEAEAALAEAEGWVRYQLLSALGRTGEAVAALRAEDVPGSEVRSWLLDPRLDPFRPDRHFTELLATLGLTEAHARAQAWRAAQPTGAGRQKAEDGGRK